MEQKMYYQNSKTFRHFITWRQRYRLGKHQYSIYSIVLIIIIIINSTSASINSQKLHLDNYNNNNRNYYKDNEDDYEGSRNDNGQGFNGRNVEHGRRHGHKYTQTIDSLLNSLKNSKNTIMNLDRETPRMPRLPYDSPDASESVCPTCYFERNSDELRLEAIKLQILSKLGLKEKPDITLPVPREIVMETLSRAGDYVESNGDLLWGGVGGAAGGTGGRGKEVNGEQEPKTEEVPVESEPDDFYGRTSEIIMFARPGQLLNGQTLLEFSHSSESDSEVFLSQLRVKSALLWVRVALNRSIIVSHRSTATTTTTAAAATSSSIAGNKNLTLWVFKVKLSMANTSFLSGKDFDEHTELVGSLSVSLLNMGWQKIDVSVAVRDWYREGSLQKEKLRLLVDCSGCKDHVQVLIFQRIKSSRPLSYPTRAAVDHHGRPFGDKISGGGRGAGRGKFDVGFGEDTARGGHVKNVSSQNEKLDPNRPFLVVHTEPIVMKRTRRRALDCSGAVRGQCCKQNFFVSFKELKWDDWIIAPKGYHANYCRGDCGGMHRTPDTFLNYHTHVIEEYRKMDRLSGTQPCCAPVKFSSMSLIYFGPDNNIIKRDLPKMVVEQCGCP